MILCITVKSNAEVKIVTQSERKFYDADKSLGVFNQKK